jgi:hypothetical protein
MTEFAKLKNLEADQTVIFRTHIEADDALVRTGCSSEYSFFHCILYSYSKDYPSMNNKDRAKLLRGLRASLVKKIDRESWEGLNDGLTARNAFKENMVDILLNCYRFFKDDPKAHGSATHRVIKKLIGDNEKTLEICKLITDLIPLTDGFKEKIISVVFDKNKSQQIASLRDTISKETVSYLKNKKEMETISKDKLKYMCDLTQKFITYVMKEADEKAFKHFIENSDKLIGEVDSFTIYLLSKLIKRDIYIIDRTNRMPYLNPQTVENLKQRKSIIILCMGEGKYEIIGKLLDQKTINYEFEHSDPVVKKMYTFLVNPEQVSEKFEELVKYLPEKFRGCKEEDNNSDDSEEEESEEDSEEEESN